jgi:hypothetical protein
VAIETMKAEYYLFVSIVLLCVVILSMSILLILIFGLGFGFGIRMGTGNSFSEITPIIAVGAIIMAIFAACVSLVILGKSRVR